jgi:hypothetical protein
MVAKKKRSAKAKGAKEELGEEGRDMMAIAGAVVLACLIIGIVIYMSLGTESDIGRKVVLSDIADEYVAAIEEASDMKVDGSMQITIDMEQMNMDVDVEVEGEYDLAAEEMRMNIVSSMPNMFYGGAVEEEINIYLIDKIMYMEMPGMYAAGKTWVKQKVDESWIDYGPEDIVGILGGTEGEVIGYEEIDGKRLTKIKVEPDMNEIVQTILEMQMGDLSAYGVSQSELDGVIDQFVDMVKKLDMTLWMDEEEYLIYRIEATIEAEYDLSSLMGMAGKIDILLLMSMDIRYEDVDISLPDEAKDALDLDEYLEPSFPTFCGDGFCDMDEDSDTCPEDCLEEGCVDTCGDGECAEIVCMGVGCPCPETPENCPEDCGNSTVKNYA